MQLSHYLSNGDPILISALAVLLAMSVMSWYIIAARSIGIWRAKRANASFVDAFWGSPNLDEALGSTSDLAGPLAQTTRLTKKSYDRYREQSYATLRDSIPLDSYLTRNIRHNLARALRPYDSGLSALASIGATSPFVGLFGTVWGINHALINISNMGQVTLAVVSGPIGEALTATAFGLFVAIPAVLGYNALDRANKNLAHDAGNFAHDLHAQFVNEGKKA